MPQCTIVVDFWLETMADRQTIPTFAGMKAKYIPILLLIVLVVPLCLTACGEDRWKAYEEQTRTDCWIDDTMRVWYYWKSEMPDENKVNYFQAPFTFFKNLLSKSDKFSTIDSLSTSTSSRSIPYTDYSYGLQFDLHQAENNDTAYYAHLLYVAAESPAAEIGLKRGDWIVDMNGEVITKSNYTRLYGGAAMPITCGYYDAETGSIRSLETSYTLPTARAIEDNPVHHSSIIEIGTKRIGYLVYNHFTAGTEDNSEKFNEQLRALFSSFAGQGVNELVLDLRYNNGGLLTCAQLLCSMIAPTTVLDLPLGYLEYDASQETEPSVISFKQGTATDGSNLNLSRLYVLTSNQTASASEMLINCLRPYMEVVTIGATTVGKNVGSIAFENPDLMITMSPIVCKIYNADMESEYAGGLKADYSIDEHNYMNNFLPFGDPNEALLNTALQVIVNGTTPETAATRSTSQGGVIVSSIEQYASNGVIIR